MNISKRIPDQAVLSAALTRLGAKIDAARQAEQGLEVAVQDKFGAVNAFRDLLRLEASDLDALFGLIMSSAQLLDQATLKDVFRSANLPRDIRLELADRLIQAFVKDAISNDCLTIKSWHLGVLGLIMFFSSKEAVEVSVEVSTESHEISYNSWSEFIEIQRKERAQFMYEIIQAAQGNMSEAARRLGMQRQTLVQNIGTLREQGLWPYD